jgi:hypothetical protein
MKQACLIVTKKLMLTWTPTLTENITKTAGASRSQTHILSRLHDTWNTGSVHPFNGDPSRLRNQEMPHVNKDSIPITFSSSWK